MQPSLAMTHSPADDADLSARLTEQIARRHGIVVVCDGSSWLVAWPDGNDFVHACTLERVAVRSIRGHVPSREGLEPDAEAVADFSSLMAQGWDDFLVTSLIDAHRFLRSSVFQAGHHLLVFGLMPLDRFPRFS